jgi:hypothetical protein
VFIVSNLAGGEARERLLQLRGRRGDAMLGGEVRAPRDGGRLRRRQPRRDLRGQLHRDAVVDRRRRLRAGAGETRGERCKDGAEAAHPATNGDRHQRFSGG